MKKKRLAWVLSCILLLSSVPSNFFVSSAVEIVDPGVESQAVVMEEILETESETLSSMEAIIPESETTVVPETLGTESEVIVIGETEDVQTMTEEGEVPIPDTEEIIIEPMDQTEIVQTETASTEGIITIEPTEVDSESGDNVIVVGGEEDTEEVKLVSFYAEAETPWMYEKIQPEHPEDMGLTLTAVYSDGTVEQWNYEKEGEPDPNVITFSYFLEEEPSVLVPQEEVTAGDYLLTVTFQGMDATIPIEVKPLSELAESLVEGANRISEGCYRFTSEKGGEYVFASQNGRFRVTDKEGEELPITEDGYALEMGETCCFVVGSLYPEVEEVDLLIERTTGESETVSTEEPQVIEIQGEEPTTETELQEGESIIETEIQEEELSTETEIQGAKFSVETEIQEGELSTETETQKEETFTEAQVEEVEIFPETETEVRSGVSYRFHVEESQAYFVENLDRDNELRLVIWDDQLGNGCEALERPAGWIYMLEGGCDYFLQFSSAYGMEGFFRIRIAAVSDHILELQARIDGLPSVGELTDIVDSQEDEKLSAVLDEIDQVYLTYEELTDQEKGQIDSSRLDEIRSYLNRGIEPMAETPEEKDDAELVIGLYKGNTLMEGQSICEITDYSEYQLKAELRNKRDEKKDVTDQCEWTVSSEDHLKVLPEGKLRTMAKKSNVSLTASYTDEEGETYVAECTLDIVNLQAGSNVDVLTYAALSGLSYLNFAPGQKNQTIGEILEDIAWENGGTNAFINRRVETGATIASFYSAAAAQWRLVDFMASINGFQACVFSNSGVYVIAYRGTGGLQDLWADICLGVGKNTSQFHDAIQLYDKFAANGSVILTGHSLGGGLANYVSVVRGAPAYTFNAPSTMVSAMVGDHQTDFARYFRGLDDGLRIDFCNEKDWVGNTGVGDNASSTASSNLNFVNGQGGGLIDRTYFVVNQSGSITDINDPGSSGLGMLLAPYHFFNQMLAYDMYNQRISFLIRDTTNPITYNFNLRMREYALGSTGDDQIDIGTTNDAIIFGGSGNDLLSRKIAKTSSLEDDFICGGLGNDHIYMVGGNINQKYFYTKGDGCDIIKDHMGTDKIDVYGCSDVYFSQPIGVQTNQPYYVLYADGAEIMRVSAMGSGEYQLYVNGVYIKNGGAKRMGDCMITSAACPVDMYIYDPNGNEAVVLKDGALMQEDKEFGSFYVEENNGEYVKTAILFEDGYTVKLKGIGEGTMKYSCTVSEGDSMESRAVSDIPVHVGAVYTAYTDFEEGILDGDLDGDGTIDYRASYVEPASISLNVEQEELRFVDTVSLEAAILPAEALQEVRWTSSDTDVAIVDGQGSVTAVGTGEAEITAVSVANQDLQAVCRITVSDEKIPIEEVEFSLEEVSYTYTGDYIEPEITAVYQGVELAEGIYYTVEYTNNLLPGTAEILIQGKGTFSDSVTLTFEIQEAPEPTVERKVEQLMEECLESGAKTEYEIALWFHDWIITHANYDYSLTEYYADGVLLKGKGVCQSYTLAFKALLDKAGIENVMVTAPEMDHAWNIVKIDGVWTHIDCTWDDPNYGGHENHQYFGMGDAEMERDHIWDRSQYPQCFRLQREVSAEDLPSPYELDEPVVGIDFTFLDTAGNILARKEVVEDNILLVFGREECGNTMAFLNDLVIWKDVLEEKGVKVIAVMESEEEAASVGQSFPFTCVSEMDGGIESSLFLGRVGLDGFITYPLVVLQNRQGSAFYYSTGYVNNPEKVVATAVEKLPETEEIPSIPLYVYSNRQELEDIVLEALKNGVSSLRLSSRSGQDFSSDDLTFVIGLLSLDGNPYGGQWESYRMLGSCIEFEITYVTSHEHNWIAGAIVVEPGCTTEGLQEYTCSICQETVQSTIAPLGHQSVTDPAVSATCTRTGLTQGSHCQVCGEILVSQQFVSLLPHTYIFKIDREPSCSEAGSQHQECTVCGRKGTSETIPATGNHSWMTKVDQAATCGAAGSQHKECTVCGAKGTTESIAATGQHSYKEIISKEATCGEDGRKFQQCTVCGAQKAAETIPATGKHQYGSYQVTKEATVLAAGTKTRTCSVCGDKDMETVQKLRATIKVNVKSIPLKVRQSTTAVKVTYGKGDKITSWRSSNKKVATVTSKGKITGKKAGKAVITVKLKSGKTAKITVKVQKTTVKTTKLKLDKKSLTLRKGKKYQLTATVTPITSAEKVKYKSSNKKVLTVTSKGKITAKKKGTAYVIVTSGKKTVRCKVKVR